MSLPYELARRHYEMQRILELEPGTQAYYRLVPFLSDLSSPSFLELFQHAAPQVQSVFGVYLLASRFAQLPLDKAPEALKAQIQALFESLSNPLIQEQELLLQDTKLQRYLYARHLLLEELAFHQQYRTPRPAGQIDRDQFRDRLSAYVQILRAGVGNPHLLALWDQSGWLQRWQLARTSRQSLPVSSSPRQQIAKYKLHEPAKRLYTEMEQGIANPENFVVQMQAALGTYLSELPTDLNGPLEPALRDIVQVAMRHSMKKGFRITVITQTLLQAVFDQLAPQGATQKLVLYTLTQELILGTQNLKYRLNDVSSGLAAFLAANPIQLETLKWVQHALLDSVMEIYESFSLSENALKAFMDQYRQYLEQASHRKYQVLSESLLPLLT